MNLAIAPQPGIAKMTATAWYLSARYISKCLQRASVALCNIVKKSAPKRKLKHLVAWFNPDLNNLAVISLPLQQLKLVTRQVEFLHDLLSGLHNRLRCLHEFFNIA